MSYEEEHRVAVYVDARNDAGEARQAYGWGPTADEAVEAAVEGIRNETGDDSYVMNDWEAA